MCNYYAVRDFPAHIFDRLQPPLPFAELKAAVKNIVIYKGGGGVGDLITAIPFYRALKENFPGARIIYMGVIYARFKKIFAAIPYIDEQVEYSHTDNKLEGLQDYLKLRRRMKNIKIDLLIDTQRRFMTSFALYLLRPRYFLSYSANCFFSDWKYQQPDRENVHLAAQLMSLAGVLGIKNYSYELNLNISAPIRQKVDDYLKDKPSGKGWVALIPGAGIRYKCYPADGFAAVGNKLIEQGYSVILLGSYAEKDILEAVCAAMPNKPIVPSWDCPEFGEELLYGAAILGRCRLTVCNDSGGMHLSTAVGTPVVALFGPTNPLKTGPLGQGNIVLYKGKECSPCKSWTCRMNRNCLLDITVEEIMRAAADCLEQHNNAAKLA